MTVKMKKLLDAIRKRQARAGGIGFALWYAKTIQEVVPDRKSAEKYFGPGGEFLFQHSLKEAGNKLVFRNKDMKVLGGRWASKSDSLFGDPEEKARRSFAKAVKEAKGGGDLKACMHFEAVYTSKKRDRDGDILEPKGAEIDEGMPLLWQHNAAQPLGRHVAVTGKDDEQIKGHCAIADTELGRDAAILVEFGALRISHGFAPKEYEPLSEEEAKGRPGWHIKTYDMMEVSLVSIPSNTDAVITAFGRGKLHCPLMKSWAKRMHDVRATIVKGGFDKTGRNKAGAGGAGTGGKSGASSNVVVNLNLQEGLKGLLESLEKKAGGKKGKKAEGDEEEGGGEDEGGGDEGGEKTLLEQVREQLQALAASGSLGEEDLAKVNAMVITVSEAIGAERAGGSAQPAKDEEQIEWESEEEEEDKDEEEDDDKDEEEEDDKDDESEDDKDEEDETEDKDEEEDEDKDDEEDEDKDDEDMDEGDKRDDQNEEDWDGEDMDDPSTDGKSVNALTADDSAAYLSLMLAAGKKVKKARLEQLLDDVSRALAAAD